jgi:Flp pilus assembly protein TadD
MSMPTSFAVNVYFLKAIVTALELNPNLPGDYINRGILRFERQNLEGAMADFNRAPELAPNAAKPYVDRAVLHTLAGEVDLALADLKKATALDATSLSEKDPGIASSPFKRLQSFISSNPTNARAYEARGLLRLIQGRRSEATQDFTKSLELNPKLRSEIERLMSITF